MKRPNFRSVIPSNAVTAGALPKTMGRGEWAARADAARAQRDWTTDAYCRRRLCANDGNAGDWLQYGHALKELGFYNAAYAAYQEAQTRSPADPEIPLQIGHLLKIMDRFDDAVAAFRQALGMGYADADHVHFECMLIRRAQNHRLYREKSDEQPHGVHVYLSSPTRMVAEGSKADLSTGLGGTDYSYAFAMRGFIGALDEMEIGWSLIENPEFVADIRTRSNAAVNIHLGFYPPERLRLLKGAYNIACFAWEFDRLRSPYEVTGYHAFADQATMLERADEIWVPSRHGADAVSATVSAAVHHVAAPILSNLRRKARTAPPAWRDIDRAARDLREVRWQPLAVLPRIQATLNTMAHSRQQTLQSIVHASEAGPAPAIFVTVLNVHDFRKQLRPMLEGFIQFSLANPRALLLVKMTTPDRGKLTINEFLLMDQISNAGDLVPPMVSDRIWITDEVLTREEMNRLYDIAGFYLCTSYAEGQNLPLLEAMGRAVVPVSVAHTAMADYIDADDAVVIATEVRKAEPRMTTRYGMYGIDLHIVSSDDVQDALERAAVLSPDAYARLSAAAFDVVQDRYGLPALSARLGDLVAELEHQTDEGKSA